MQEETNPSKFKQLTRRELEVALKLAIGWSSRETAEHLEISQKTVDSHRMHLFRKLCVDNNAQLARLAILDGVVPWPPVMS